MNRFIADSYGKLADHLALKAGCPVGVDLAKRAFSAFSYYRGSGDRARTLVDFTPNREFITFVFIGIGKPVIEGNP